MMNAERQRPRASRSRILFIIQHSSFSILFPPHSLPMLLPTTPEFRRRRPRPRRIAPAPPVPPPPPPPAEITVVAVRAGGDFFASVEFSGPVTCDGSGNAQLVVYFGGEPSTPDSSTQVDANTVSFFFAAGTVAPGSIWEIAAAPSGLDFH